MRVTTEQALKDLRVKEGEIGWRIREGQASTFGEGDSVSALSPCEDADVESGSKYFPAFLSDFSEVYGILSWQVLSTCFCCVTKHPQMSWL